MLSCFYKSTNSSNYRRENKGFKSIPGLYDVAEKRAVTQPFAQSTLWGFKVEAESKGSVLVDATAFLLRDAMQISKALQLSKQGNYSPDLSRSAMYMERTKNFPMNSEY